MSISAFFFAKNYLFSNGKFHRELSARNSFAGERAMRQMYEYMWPKTGMRGAKYIETLDTPTQTGFFVRFLIVSLHYGRSLSSNRQQNDVPLFPGSESEENPKSRSIRQKKSREKSAKKRQVTVRATKAIFCLNPQASEWNGYGMGEKGARTDSECLACGNHHR